MTVTNPGESRRPLGRVGLVVALAAQVVVVLDFSIVNVALPSITRELGVSSTSAQWVVTAYALTFGGLLILGGRASDLFGRRRTLIVGLIAFACASVAGGLAANLALLVAARAVQGAAAALVAPSGLSILTISYHEGPERNRVLAYYGMMASVGFVAGLVAGGILVSTVGWRGVFFVNVPLCAGLAIVGSRALPAGGHASTHRHLDLLGASLVTAGMAACVLSPTFGVSDGWGSVDFVGCVGVAAALLALFAAYERRSADPLVPMSILHHRTLLAGDAIAGLIGAWVAAEGARRQPVLPAGARLLSARLRSGRDTAGIGRHRAGRLRTEAAGTHWDQAVPDPFERGHRREPVVPVSVPGDDALPDAGGRALRRRLRHDEPLLQIDRGGQRRRQG